MGILTGRTSATHLSLTGVKRINSTSGEASEEPSRSTFVVMYWGALITSELSLDVGGTPYFAWYNDKALAEAAF